jgi:hypothetical protein
MRPTLFALVATLALGAAAIAVSPGRTLTPGPLQPAHAALRDDCLACHRLGAGPQGERCATCHRAAHIGVRTVAGGPRERPNPKAARFHRLIGTAACLACHAEHDDGTGRRPLRAFTHDPLPAALVADCAECHGDQRPADRLHQEAGAACRTCHTTTAWRPATFEHTRFFRFDRAHPPRCAACHPVPGDYRQYTCYGCHEHRPAEIAREHAEEGIRNLEHCARCHRSGDEHEALREPEEDRRAEGTTRESRAREHRERRHRGEKGDD